VQHHAVNIQQPSAARAGDFVDELGKLGMVFFIE
jgi:hypothetical protein